VGEYDFLFREYNPQQGRWISPDPAGLSAVNPGFPQTWNRYAYVMNRPLTEIDLAGLGSPLGPYSDCIGCNPWMHSSGDKGGVLDVGFMVFDPQFAFLTIDPEFVANDKSSISVFGTWTIAQGTADGGDTAKNNGPSGPVVLKNPCSVQGRALPPGAYVTQGQQANSSTVNFALDVAMGWPKGDYLDPQPLASGNVFQNQAYGNYVFGVYMASAGVSLNSALSGANAYAFLRSSYPSGTQMDPNYGSLPAANVASITNGYNAVGNGTVCHN
jgi:RHS repeat-associated protein